MSAPTAAVTCNLAARARSKLKQQVAHERADHDHEPPLAGPRAALLGTSSPSVLASVRR
jgi:hypothetical protein